MRRCPGKTLYLIGLFFHQLEDLLIAFPGSDIRLGVGDIQNQLQMVVVHATVASRSSRRCGCGELY